MLCLGLDSGTTCKGLVLDAGCRKAIAQARARHAFIDDLPRGHVERDPQTWRAAAEQVIQRCLEKIAFSETPTINPQGGISAFCDSTDHWLAR